MGQSFPFEGVAPGRFPTLRWMPHTHAHMETYAGLSRKKKMEELRGMGSEGKKREEICSYFILYMCEILKNKVLNYS